MGYLRNIPRARVGYGVIDSYNHLISNKRESNNGFNKNNREILSDLADFALQEQPEGNLMISISFQNFTLSKLHFIISNDTFWLYPFSLQTKMPFAVPLRTTSNYRPMGIQNVQNPRLNVGKI